MFAALGSRLVAAPRSTTAPQPAAAVSRLSAMTHLRLYSGVTNGRKLVAPPMVYISGEEMTAYTMQLIRRQWIEPHIDTSAWQMFDLSCRARDASEDQVLHDAVAAGRKMCAIFKEPTVTPTEVQKKQLGLKKAWGSPNGVMRRGWNGITISRDTIHIRGMELGYKRPVFLDRHAIGGEYGASWKYVGKGVLRTTFVADGSKEEELVAERKLTNKVNAAVIYDNPYDNVEDLAHHFFSRLLEANLTPYVVTKKTVFKWQEEFWAVSKRVFDEHYRDKFRKKGLLDRTGGELQHLISDAATMQVIRWTDGEFGFLCHNYDGDILSDEIAQCHRSPGFITSNLIGKREDGVMIKEFEASHGTVADMYADHLAGKETSLNPLGMVEALIGAMQHSARLALESGKDDEDANEIIKFGDQLREQIHIAMASGKGTRDLCGPEGLTTEAFIEHIGEMLHHAQSEWAPAAPIKPPVDERQVDLPTMKRLFDMIDTDGNGTIDFDEFCAGLAKLGMTPHKYKQRAPKAEQRVETA